MSVRDSLDLLRDTRANTVKLVRQLSQEQLDFAPASGKWSIGQVLDHLLLAESLYRGQIQELIDLARAGKRPFMRRTSSQVNFAPFFIPQRMMPLFEIPFTMMTLFVPKAVNEFLLRNAFLPGQSPTIALPRKSAPADELVTGLDQSVARTAAIVDANADLKWDSMAVHHPVLGVNNVPQLLRLVALHEQRHQDQIRGILKDAKFPKYAPVAA